MDPETFTQYAVEWDEKWPDYPDISHVSRDRASAQEAIDASAYTGRVIERTVTFGAWSPSHY
jgi:hypothetical protein